MTAAATGGTSQSPTLANEHVLNDYHFSSFVASEIPVTIVPRFAMARVECLGVPCGPFEPNYPVDVPLWLALYLRQTDTCTISPPPYLRVSHLLDVVSRENAQESQFQPLPFYFFEVAKKLCEVGEDIPEVSEVQRLVHEVQALRQRKLKASMAVFEPEGSAMFIPGIRLTNLISNELHYLRHSYAVVLQQAYEMELRRTQVTSMARVPAVPAASAASVMSSTPGRPTTSQSTTVNGLSTARPTTEGAVPSVSGEEAPLFSTETAATALTHEAPAPYAQPPVKKRRTLRQT